jgi:hypothetical protein
MNAPFQAFEVQNVPDFQGKPVTGILFHVGNFNADSDGCILLGSVLYNVNEPWMIRSSTPTFNKFMALQKNVTEFTLTVKDEK